MSMDIKMLCCDIHLIYICIHVDYYNEILEQCLTEVKHFRYSAKLAVKIERAAQMMLLKPLWQCHCNIITYLHLHYLSFTHV